METSLHYEPQSKHLSFRIDQRITAEPGIEVKGRGFLNTTTGAFTYSGSLRKYISTGPVLKGQGTQPLRLGAGVSLDSKSPQEPVFVACAQKSISLLEGSNTVLFVNAEVKGGTSTRKMSQLQKGAQVRVSHKLLNFTAKQDLLLTAGLDMDWTAKGKVKTEPYLALRENSWGLERRGSSWHVTYDL